MSTEPDSFYIMSSAHYMRRVFFFYLCSALILISTVAVPQTHVPSVTDDCPYCQLYGQRFRTVIDLYLFQDMGEPHYKYFGLINGSTRKPATLPSAISKSHIGHTYGTAKILGIVPAGSEFTVESATHEVLLASGEHIGLMCRLPYKGRAPLVSAEFIQVHSENTAGVASSRPNPDIDETIAVKLDGGKTESVK